MHNRAAERFDVDTSVRCVSHDERVGGYAYNLSLDGCMLDVPELCREPGDPISVYFLDDVKQDGEIVWSQDGYVGVRFLQPAHVSVVRLLRLTAALVPIEQMTPIDRFGRPSPGLAEMR